MKVKYLREGVFKNPEQARAAREKIKDLSNVEKLTSVANKIVKEPIIRFLNELLNKFLTGPYKHRYCTTYIEAYRNDPMYVAPDFMSSYCIFKNNDICDIWYEYQRVTVTDIDLENKTMDLLISLGQPHSGLPRYVVKQNNNDNIVYGTYLDNLYGLVDTSMFKKRLPCLPNLRAPFNGSNAKIASSKISYILRDIIDEFECFDERSEEDKKILEIINSKELSNFNYNCKIEWNLTQDVMFFPILRNDDYDFSQAKGNKKEGLSYISHAYYPMELNDDPNSYGGTYEDTYGTPVITVDSLIVDIETNHERKKEYTDIIDKLQSMNDMKDLAALYATSLKNLDLNIVGGGHIYLSTGYFKKNYLIV